MVMEDIPYVKSVALGIWVKTGSVDEAPENLGISHFIEHMLFKGTERRTARQIAEDSDKIAGQINAFTGKESTCYHMKTLAENIDECADILLDMFFNSRFDPEEMDKERQVIFEEMKMIEDSPEDDVHDIICELMNQGNPLSTPIIGTTESLTGIDDNAIRDYMSRKYAMDNVVIAIAGSFDEEYVTDLFERKFGQLRQNKELKQVEKVPYTPRFYSKVKDIEQSHICMATPAISREDDRFYALSLLNSIMGGTMSSRFFQNIREDKGLAYSVYSMMSPFIDEGFYNIYAGVSHEKIEAAINGIGEELASLKKDGITQEELDTAKVQMKGSYIFGMEKVAGRMFAIGRNLTLSNKVYTPDEIIESINKVTIDDIREAEELICNPETYSCAVISNSEVPVKEYIKELY